MSNIIEITDFMAPELDVYARLSEGQLLNRHEPEKGMFIAESPKVIERALDAGCVPVSFLAERRHVGGEGKELIERCGDIPAYTAEFDVLTQLTGFNLTRGMLCAMYRPKLPSVEAVCSNPLYRRAIRVSMGTVFQIPWTFLSCGTKKNEKDLWQQEGVKLLHELGFKAAAFALRDDSVEIDVPELMAEDRLAIILGPAGAGRASSTIADCDYTVKIPMSHGVDSLNVAAASAVAFWQLGNKEK